ncbi:MAG: MerR family transcriptional regulator [Pseudomonadota bacterium]
MNIKQASERTGLPAKTIRYYEEIGLVAPGRGSNGYRVFSASDVHNLAFVGRARMLGFTVEDCRALLLLYQDSARESAEAKKIAEAHLRQIEDRISKLREMADTLGQLVAACAGDQRPECPILGSLAAMEDR